MYYLFKQNIKVKKVRTIIQWIIEQTQRLNMHVSVKPRLNIKLHKP